MRTVIAAILLFVTSTSSLFAQDEVLPVLIISDNGYAWMIQDSTGKPVMYQFSNVIVLGKNGPKLPPVVTNPPVSTPTEFGLVDQTKQWLGSVTTDAGKKHAAKIAAAIKAVADKSDEFKELGEMEAALGISLKSVLSDAEIKADWKAFGSAMFAAITAFKLPTVGKIKTTKDMSRALLEVVKGLQ